MTPFGRALTALTGNTVVHKLITDSRPGNALARRFVAGTELHEAIAVAHRLNEAGMSVSMNLLGEEVTDVASAEAATDGYLACLEGIASQGLNANISVKLTQLGLGFDRNLATRLLGRLAGAALVAGTTVTIDMEDSSYTEATIDLYADAGPRFGNLGVCLQSYLRRSPQHLARLLPLGGHIRLCKGAYVEPEEIAFQDKADVDAAFASLLSALFSSATVRPAVATHDDRLIALARKLSTETGEFEFQMLYGVRPSLQKELVTGGYQLRIFLPYGTHWYSYLTRRLAERPANLWFFLRAVANR